MNEASIAPSSIDIMAVVFYTLLDFIELQSKSFFSGHVIPPFTSIVQEQL